ncbi:MAG: hypothetical protein DMF88_19455 [Acidobacteria bacterium]|nr:MAG: hypothetical protein DMF88_19455 [Acidobacteriota bacterium]
MRLLADRPAILHRFDGDRDLIAEVERVLPVAGRIDDVRRLSFGDPSHDFAILAHHVEAEEAMRIRIDPARDGAFQHDFLADVERRGAVMRGERRR